MRVLVVEDERVLGSAIATALGTALSAEVDIAFDGRAALRLAAENEYVLVVLDFGILPPTGLELLRLWRDNDRMGPIVMMSGSYEGPERSTALTAGASLFFEKPFSLVDLVDGVRALLPEIDFNDLETS